MATGGTAKSVANILHNEGKKITGLLTVVAIKDVAKEKFSFPVGSMIKM